MGALACVPQTTALYETLPLFLVPRGRPGGYVLAIGGYAAAFVMAHSFPWAAVSSEPFEANLARR